MKINVGTRDSQLAVSQTQQLLKEIKPFAPFDFEVITMKTKGDRNIKDRFEKLGDKGLFTKELDDALKDKKIDLAVHSFKDLPSTLPEGIALGGVSECDHPEDAWVSDRHLRFDDLPQGSVVGTSSVRRTALLRNRRPDLVIVPARGNVQTRLKKMRDEKMSGIILAASGLVRAGLENEIRHKISSDWCTPAPGQGYLAITVRDQDFQTLTWLKKWQNQKAWQETSVIHAIMKKVQGGCTVPLGITCGIQEGEVTIRARCLSVDGQHNIETQFSCGLNDLAHAADHVYSLMESNGSTAILKGTYVGHKN